MKVVKAYKYEQENLVKSWKRTLTDQKEINEWIFTLVFFFNINSSTSVSDGDVNGDLSGDEQSINSDHPVDRQDEDSMDSDRGGALNLVSTQVEKGDY